MRAWVLAQMAHRRAENSGFFLSGGRVGARISIMSRLQRLAYSSSLAVGLIIIALGLSVQGAAVDTSESAVNAEGSNRLVKGQSIIQSSETIHDQPGSQLGLLFDYVSIDGKRHTVSANGIMALPAHNSGVSFHYRSDPAVSNAPIRFRCQLDGYETDWHERTEQMRLLIRFTDAKMEQISETAFPVVGQSAGWTGSIGKSSFIQRKETLTVPTGAVYYWVVITSAGPPVAVGVYALKNLVVSQSSTNVQRLIPAAEADANPGLGGRGIAPVGWSRAGMRLRDAWVVLSGPLKETTLAIVDVDPVGHADWNSPRIKLPDRKIIPGDPLTFEWEEAYSIGMTDYGSVDYRNIPAGLYRFRIVGLDVMGLPNGRELSVPVQVPVAYWQTGWFWMAAFLALVGLVAGALRLTESRKMNRRIQIVERQRALDQERLRIAQDIHDDLGARVTEISLLSSAAQLKAGFSEEARAEFGSVCRMSRDLVQALYETVWAVSPENDHLDSLANYVCQMANEMCAQPHLKCRLEIPELPADVPVNSHVRHNVIMAVKESIHNAIKHANATELRIQIQLDGLKLSIEVSDNGKGFDASSKLRGNGLANMERRMHAAGGEFAIESSAGQGTKVHLELPLERKS